MPNFRKDKKETAPDNAVLETDVTKSSILVRLKKPFLPVDRLFWLLLLIALVLTSGNLYRRLGVEWSNRIVSIVLDYADLVSLSRHSGQSMDDIYNRMTQKGVRGITVDEYMGKDLSAGAMPLYYGSLASIDTSQKKDAVGTPDSAAILIDSKHPYLPPIMEYLRTKYVGVEKYVPGANTLIVLPATVQELHESGVLPDFGALEFAKRLDIAVVFRPSSSVEVKGSVVAESLRWLKERYPDIACVLPSGQIVAGYPDLKPLGEALTEMSLPLGQAEFVRQVGIGQLNAMVKPNLLPLHSLVRDELISRRLTRMQVVERMVRAVHERSIRLLLMRPYDLYTYGKLDYLVEDLGKIHDSLVSKGYLFGWPKTLPNFSSSLFAALGLAVVLVTTLWFFARRYIGEIYCRSTLFEALFLAFLSLIIGLLVWKVSFFSRLVGGLTAALVATEATLWALDRYNKPFAGLLAGLLIVLAGGLSIASYYGTTAAMLRLQPFSGVKLTLLLPPLLVLAVDLKQRVHPESFAGIMDRAPKWGELVLVGALMIGAVILTVRSGNTAFVPDWEIRARDILERVMWVRPRTKEFLIGYPAVIIYYALVRRGWAVNYREVFRVAASLAFASAINTFCHFHTLLPLTMVRVVNGWLLGILLGFVSVLVIDYIGGPVWRRGAREMFR